MLVFVAILMLGLVYVWVKGDLEWIRSIKGDPRGVPNVVSRTAPALPAIRWQPPASERSPHAARRKV